MPIFVALLCLLSQQDDVEKLRRELEELRKRVDAIQPSTPATTKNQDKEAETIFDEGFWFVGKDDRLRIGASGQADARFFLNDEAGDSNYLIRRARVFATGILEEKFSYMVMGRWDQQTPALHFAWIESQHLPYARFRVGLFKEPFSMEGLHSDQYWDFAERSLAVSNFLQLEDVGAMFYGKCWEDRVEYGIGTFNGRGRSTENNPDKEYAGRLVLAPFRKAIDFLNDFYIGVSGSISGQEESLGGTGFQTGAATRFWTWGSSPATSVDDDRTRWGADIEWLYGPVAIRAEVVAVDWGDIVRSGTKEPFTGSGWFVEAAYVLTGEPKRRNRPIRPGREFNPAEGTWGAIELVARYEAFTLEGDLLDAGFATGTDKVDGWTAGINFQLNKHVAAKINLQRLSFDDPVTVSSHQVDDEFVLFVRFQFEI